MTTNIKDGKSCDLADLSTDAFGTRLNWLKDKFNDIERASCKKEVDDSSQLSQTSIDDLMASLGL